MFKSYSSWIILYALCGAVSNHSALADSRPAMLPATFATVATSATFRVALAEPAGATYQWFKNGVAIPAADAATFSIPVVQIADAGAYHVIVSNSAGSAISRPAGLSVIVQPNLVSLLPTDRTVAPGTNVVLRAAATGKNLSYQWYCNGSLLRRQNSGSLSLSNVNAASSGTYSLTISNKSGPIAAATAILRVESP